MTEHASSIAALGDRFGQLALANRGDRRPPGPAGFGTVGKAFSVRANHYPLQLNAGDRSVIHYDVTVDGDDVKKDENGLPSVGLVRRVFTEFLATDKKMRQFAEVIAFDGRKNFFMIEPGLPFGGLKERSFEVKLPDKRGADRPPRTFRLTIRIAAKISLGFVLGLCRGDRQAIQAAEGAIIGLQALNVAIRRHAAENYHQQGASGQRFFSRTERKAISGGAEIAVGFFQSIRPSMSGLTLNLDTAYTAFVKGGPAIQVCGALVGRRGPLPQLARPYESRELAQLRSKLVGASYKVTHRTDSPPQVIDTISVLGADKLDFELNRNGQRSRTTVVDYFFKTHNIRLNAPQLVCIGTGKKRPAFTPLELCEILPNHPIPPTRLTSDQTSEIIKEAAKRPQERQQKITSWRQQLGYNQPILQSYMIDVPARVLSPPRVNYNTGSGQGGIVKEHELARGSWNLRDVKFVRSGMPLKSWSVLVFANLSLQAVQTFMTSFVQMLLKCGIAVETRQPPIIQGDQNKPIAANIKEAGSKAYNAGDRSGNGPQLIFIILPDKSKVFYESVKRAAMLDLPSGAMQLCDGADLAAVVTQCAQAQKIARFDPQYAANIAMKINAKLGGTNHAVAGRELPKWGSSPSDATLILGADVTHPTGRPAKGDSYELPSIAAVVGSTDNSATTYKAEVRLQKSKQEKIDQMEEMVTILIQSFTQGNNKTRPGHIILYRDGVSEGQYDMVLSHEYAAIKRACGVIDPRWAPKINIVICGKRHHTRFFAKNQAQEDRTGNLPSGTIVDQGVTSAIVFDWFLQSHAGLQGTARPTHYICLKNETGYTPDELENLTHRLCFTFMRATKSVSLVPATFYADIVLEKARPMVYGLNDGADTLTHSSAPRDDAAFHPLKIQSRINANADMQNVAWFI